MKPQTLLAIVCFVMANAYAQDCKLPDGAIGLGNYCQKQTKAQVSPHSQPQQPMASFQLQPPETVRGSLSRWSKQAGWVFETEHYAVAVDIPVVASASMPADFKTAVRVLLDSTALTDTPLQPCFYSNQVLRVVLRTERCDRL